MRKKLPLFAVVLAVTVVCACSEGPIEEPEGSFPAPVNVYDDSAVVEAAPTPAPAPSPAPTGAQAQFECEAGAADATATMASDSADRPDDDGQPMTVRVYDPAGAQVFGFPVTVFETFTRADGRSGIAAYVAPPRETVLPAILARFPGSSVDAEMRISGPGMAGQIALQEASLGSGTVTRIQCGG